MDTLLKIYELSLAWIQAHATKRTAFILAATFGLALVVSVSINITLGISPFFANASKVPLLEQMLEDHIRSTGALTRALTNDQKTAGERFELQKTRITENRERTRNELASLRHEASMRTKGVSENMARVSKMLDERMTAFHRMEEKAQKQIEIRLSSIDNSLETALAKLNIFTVRFHNFAATFNASKETIDAMHISFDTMDRRIDTLHERVGSLVETNKAQIVPIKPPVRLPDKHDKRPDNDKTQILSDIHDNLARFSVSVDSIKRPTDDTDTDNETVAAP